MIMFNVVVDLGRMMTTDEGGHNIPISSHIAINNNINNSSNNILQMTKVCDDDGDDVDDTHYSGLVVKTMVWFIPKWTTVHYTSTSTLTSFS